MRTEWQRSKRILAAGLILLAAGGSTRLGAPKQLLPFAGRTLLRHAAETALASGCAPIVAVLGADADRMRRELDGLDAITVVKNPDWHEGMASSLRHGIEALESLATVDAAAVLLCDQPFVSADLLRALVAALIDQPPCPPSPSTGGQGGSVQKQYRAAVSVYASGATGPPCIVARSLFPDLLTLRGAEGARQVLRRLPPETIARVPFPEGDQDIDTPADWMRLRNLRNNEKD